MSFYIFQFISVVILASVFGCGAVESSSEPESGQTAPAASEPVSGPSAKQIAIFAGGCFWGVEAVFEHTKGVSDVKSGYSGGDAKSASYDAVSGGRTQHAEAVHVTFDPEKVTYEELLDVFFKVAHDPTELNRQGPDEGPQYRSAIFYVDEVQRKAAASYIEKIGTARVYKKPIVTQVVPLEKFYDAEAYHQDYLPRNLDSPYIIYHDLPKLENLKKQFPALYVKK